MAICTTDAGDTWIRQQTSSATPIAHAIAALNGDTCVTTTTSASRATSTSESHASRTRTPSSLIVSPPGATESRLLLARASTPEQEARIGNQTGGRVFLFLYTDDFWRDYELFRSQGIEFARDPKGEPYGTVAVFKDLYGNLWDLIEPR